MTTSIAMVSTQTSMTNTPIVDDINDIDAAADNDFKQAVDDEATTTTR